MHSKFMCGTLRTAGTCVLLLAAACSSNTDEALAKGEVVAESHAALVQPGLDATFGTDGIGLTQFGNSINNFRFADAALDANGNSLVAGVVSGQNGVIVRYLANGALDSTFGSAGVAVLAIGSLQIAPMSLFALADGKILVLVASTNGASSGPSLLLRLTASGQLDASFGGGGQVTVSFPASTPLVASAALVLAQPDGKIVLAGAATPPRHNTTPARTVIGRYLANGAVDTTFGNAGFASEVAVGKPNAVAVLSDDSIVAVNGSAAVAQFSSSGALLATPNAKPVSASKSVGAGLGRVAFLPNGQYLLAQGVIGEPRKRVTYAQVTRFDANGVADNSFQPTLVTFGNTPLTQSIVQSITLDPAGRIVIAGAVHPDTVGTELFGVARLNTNGSLDTSFGVNGTLATSVALAGSAWSVLTQSDSKIVSFGTVQVAKDTNSTTVDLAIVRYLSQ